MNEPTAGRKRHSYASDAERQLEHAEARHVARPRCSAAPCGNVRRFLPPVPTTNSRIPRAGRGRRRPSAARSARSRGRDRRGRGRRSRRRAPARTPCTSSRSRARRTRSAGGASTRACTRPGAQRGPPQPLLLRRAGAAAADDRAVRVQRDDVPAAEVVAVVPLRRVAGRRAEVPEVAGRAVASGTRGFPGRAS